ncbi:hypothetical protein C8F04DRAFT_273802 [Mycena alexandri]|uniref:Uncharacterized protein n=1 Tax=Mycena alexandri TaxID=1745969 RepID=A0AAD6S8N0_9AGAR|nr:hypothetical protein C8F04DRAFT_273802 [Mycena alexandri]
MRPRTNRDADTLPGEDGVEHTPFQRDPPDAPTAREGARVHEYDVEGEAHAHDPIPHPNSVCSRRSNDSYTPPITAATGGACGAGRGRPLSPGPALPMPRTCLRTRTADTRPTRLALPSPYHPQPLQQPYARAGRGRAATAAAVVRARKTGRSDAYPFFRATVSALKPGGSSSSHCSTGTAHERDERQAKAKGEGGMTHECAQALHLARLRNQQVLNSSTR